MAARLKASSNLQSPPDTYFYTLAQAGPHSAVIGSDNTLRIFSSPTLQVTKSVNAAHSGITCLTTSADGLSFVTAGRDARIRTWDPRVAMKSPTLELTEPKSAGFSALSCSANCIAAGTESTKEGLGDVSVLIYDLRSPAEPLRIYPESHTDTITTLAWHPTQPSLLLSGSTDGLASVFDANVIEEEDALMQVLNPRSAVHRAGFLTEDQVYTLSTDEQFSLYGLDKTGTAEEEALPVKQFGDLREKLKAMYVIELVQQPFLTAPVLAFGHNVDQTLSLLPFQIESESFGTRVELPGAHGEEVVRDVMFLDSESVLTCGEDGCVKLWGLAAVSGEAGGEVGTVSGPKKAKRKEKKGSERFAPY